ncbi:MAG TPA: hypothetical protein VNW46_06295 [Gemmatimonadaceae bacterium]|jgi:hypothetical protein|nr:hypothetical protein [Gemmatimonadaceae bacterium]
MPGFRCYLALSATLAALASPALAQTGVTSDPTPAAVSSEPAPSGPTLDNATSGIRANTAHEDLTTAEAAHRAATGGSGLSKGAVILIVGGAALAAGVLIGGTGGAALAIGGALVALYGLYLLLQ